MKAREIKKTMLDDYKSAIEGHKDAIVHLTTMHDKIKEMELNLKRYFNIDMTYNFLTGTSEKDEPEVDDVPF